MGAVLGALIGLALHYGFALWSEWLMSVGNFVIGIGAGFGARVLARGKGNLIGAIAAITAVLIAGGGELLIDHLEQFEPDKEAAQTITFNLLFAGIGGALVGRGFDPISVVLALLIGDHRELTQTRNGENLRGTQECPECGSMQTEPDDATLLTGAPKDMVCNACTHRWPIP